jgi:hypothetical protein
MKQMGASRYIMVGIRRLDGDEFYKSRNNEYLMTSSTPLFSDDSGKFIDFSFGSSKSSQLYGRITFMRRP